MREVYWQDVAHEFDTLSVRELQRLPRDRGEDSILYPPSTCGMCGSTYAVALQSVWDEDGADICGMQVACRCGLRSPVCQHPGAAWAIWERMHARLLPLRGPHE